MFISLLMFNHLRTLFQTACTKEHLKNKCSMVSREFLQNEHLLSASAIHLFLVYSLPLKLIQSMNENLGGMYFLQMILIHVLHSSLQRSQSYAMAIKKWFPVTQDFKRLIAAGTFPVRCRRRFLSFSKFLNIGGSALPQVHSQIFLFFK